ncbi:MFS transporter [Nocardia sp. 2]|uniref:MFS transporter n=1 Tax=Nocardia acididurans TaxID=2802282 RepID=A0ABS1MEH8_9NOCA|nr:MFS transporter [Nocardia acididurans]MBL1078505.1 MFS transporter [Nocardia acididurans]
MSTTVEQLPPPTDSASAERWGAVWCLSLGIFVIVTAEILPIGLLPEIGAEFGVSHGTTGLLMTLPGILAAVSAPLVTIATSRVDRRIMLVALLITLVVANLMCASAPAFWVLLGGRALLGVVIGGFWSIGAGLSPRLVRSAATAKATAVIFAAVPAGSVIGVPAGTELGRLAGWRWSFVVLGVGTALVAGALAYTLPRLPAIRITSGAVLLTLLRKRGTGVHAGLLVTAMIVIAHFGAYTYVTPFLRETTGVGEQTVSVYLLLYGVAGIAGTAVAGRTLARGPRATFTAAAALIATTTLLLPVLGQQAFAVVAALLVWGLAYGMVPACSQTWFARSAPQHPEAATVLFTSSFQFTLAAGALLGGLVVDASSTATVMACAGALAILTAGAAWALGSPARWRSSGTD